MKKFLLVFLLIFGITANAYLTQTITVLGDVTLGNITTGTISSGAITSGAISATNLILSGSTTFTPCVDSSTTGASQTINALGCTVYSVTNGSLTSVNFITGASANGRTLIFENLTGGTVTLQYNATINGGIITPDGTSDITVGNGQRAMLIYANSARFWYVLGTSQLQTPTSSWLGGVKSKAAVSHQWLASLGTDGALTSSQPALSDMTALTVSRAAVTDSSGFVAAATTTATEIGYVNGVTSAIQTQLNAKQGTSLTSTNIWVGNGSGVAAAVAMSGDATMANTGAVTLANTAVSANSYGSSLLIPVITVDSKGRLTAASTAAIGVGLEAYAAKTVAYTTVATDNNLSFDMSGSSNASYAVTLHTAVGNSGQVLAFTVTTGTGVLSFNTTSSQTIGGLASGVIKMGKVGDRLMIYSDGANWKIKVWDIYVGMKYTNSAGTSCGATTVQTTMPFATKIYDYPAANYASSIYTIPYAGTYHVDVELSVVFSIAAATLFDSFIITNSSGESNVWNRSYASAISGNSAIVSMFTNGNFKAAAGDTLTIKSTANFSSGTCVLYNDATTNSVGITRVGN